MDKKIEIERLIIKLDKKKKTHEIQCQLVKLKNKSTSKNIKSKNKITIKI